MAGLNKVRWSVKMTLHPRRFLTTLRHKHSIVFVALALLLPFTLNAADMADSADDPSSQGGKILTRYLQATQYKPSAPDAMEVDIDASVPRLNVHGSLKALRRISEVGKITYRVLGFQGDNSVKNQVIARYLQADQESQQHQNIGIVPANYKFKFKGAKLVGNGKDVYVFQLSPRKKRVGLFKGELWLDSKTCLPVYEKGRFVRNPSVFFHKVDFERAFAIQNGLAVPARMNSTIQTRLVGKVNLSVAYSSPSAEKTQIEQPTSSALAPASYFP